MSTQPYAVPNLETMDEETDFRSDIRTGVRTFAKPRAIAQLVADDPNALEMRPLRAASQNPDRTMQGMPGLKSAASRKNITIEGRPGERPYRVRASGTPSPVPLFGRTEAQRAAMAIVPVSKDVETVPFETVLMPHAEHDKSLQETVAIVQAAQAQAAATAAIVMQERGQVQIAPAAPSVVVGELDAKALTKKSKYAAYEEIGLVDPRAHVSTEPKPSFIARIASRLIVSTYRLIGFLILTVIVAVLVGYITTTAFYYVSKSWIVPTVVSPSDDKVVQLRTELAAQQNVRDKLEADLRENDRVIAAELQFQAEFVNAVKADLEGRRVALGRVQALAGAAYSTRSKISSTNDAYAKQIAEQTAKELEAGLVDRNHAMSANFQVAQISDTQLRLQQSEIQLQQQATELKAQTDALDALLDGKSADKRAISYDVLKIKKDYDVSKQALDKAKDGQKLLQASLARQDEILAGLRQSAYLRALDDHAVVALVPYGNLENAKPGTTLYSCKVNMVWCHEAGEVLQVLPGEIQFKNPHRDATVRGQMVELKLTDSDAATDEVLFVGGEPLGF